MFFINIKTLLKKTIKKLFFQHYVLLLETEMHVTECVHGTPFQELNLSGDFKSKTELKKLSVYIHLCSVFVCDLAKLACLLSFSLSFVTERVVCARLMTEQPISCFDLAVLINDHGSSVVLWFTEKLCIDFIYITLFLKKKYKNSLLFICQFSWMIWLFY